MTKEGLARLNTSLGAAAPRGIEVLTATELDVVSAGGPYSADSVCVSQCHIDGNDEPGTS